MSRLFGTDGIRGKAGFFPLDPTTIRLIGRSLARHLQKGAGGRPPLIITGRDTRESGERIEHALVTGAVEAGALCESAEVITTPGVAFLTRSLAADAGVVISASHNPYEDNGIKVFEPSGRKLNDATERRIEADIHEVPSLSGSENLASPTSESFKNQRPAAALRELYFEFLANDMASDLSLAGFSLVVDCANGAASDIAPRLFTQLGARLIAINNTPNGQNINRDCGSLHLQSLQRRVVEENADLGVAFDGDADRALFVDSAGNFVDGDATLWILAKYLQDRALLNRNTVVATVMTNIGLEIALSRRGISLLRTDVGDKYVLEELLRTHASVGGEQSGHIIFPHVSLAGDGIITTLFLLRALRESMMTLEELAGGFQRYPQILLNVPVREKRDFEAMPEVSRLANQTKARLGDKGRLLLRYSGTESLARVMIEGENRNEIEESGRALADAIERELGLSLEAN